MHSKLLLAAPLICSVLVLFTVLSVEALPTNISSLLEGSNSNGLIPPKKFKQDDTEDEEEDGDGETEAGTVAGSTPTPVGLLPNGALTSTYNNVGTILGGILDGNVGSVLTGGTAFIPAGDLRNNVNLLLQGAVIPSVERVAMNVVPVIQARFNESTTTPFPTIYRGAITTTTAASLFSDPLAFISSRLQGLGGGGESRDNPVKDIQTRLQLLFGGGSNSAEKASNVESGSSNSNKNVNQVQSGIYPGGSNKNLNRVNTFQSGIYNSHRNAETVNNFQGGIYSGNRNPETVSNFQGGIYNNDRNAETVNKFQGGILDSNRNVESINNNFQNGILNNNRNVNRVNNNHIQTGILNSNKNVDSLNTDFQYSNSISNIVRVSNNIPPSSNTHYAPDPVNINRFRQSIPASPV